MTTKIKKVQYPEHEKLQKVKEESQGIGQFLDWLMNKYTVCEFLKDWDNGEPMFVNEDTGEPSTLSDFKSVNNSKHESRPAGYYAVGKRIEDWLNEYFDIDPKKLEGEKQAMLDSIRNYNAKN